MSHLQTYHFLIDSIQLRVEDVGIEQLFKYEYSTEIENYDILHKHHQSYLVMFKIRTVTNPQTKQVHQLISFNGFHKYHPIRDNLLKKVFYDVIDVLMNNDIKFYLNKLDLAIDITDVNIKDIYVRRKKYTGVQHSIKYLSSLDLTQVVSNQKSFYLEKASSSKTSKQRLYIYNKTKKEQNRGNLNLEEEIYRIEAELVNFNDIKKKIDKKQSNIELESLSHEFGRRKGEVVTYDDIAQLDISKKFIKLEFQELLLQEIISRFNKYDIKCMNKPIYFDYSIVEEILPFCINL